MRYDVEMIHATSLVAVPIIIAIVQAIKMTGFVKPQFAPLLSIVIGIIIGFLTNHDQVDLGTMLLGGAVYGLMASGLYSGVKTTVEATKNPNSNPKPNPYNPNQ